MNTNNQRKIGLGIGVIAILAIVAVSVLGAKKSNSAVVADTSDTTAVADTSTTGTTSPSKGSSAYKDGTYTATGSYMSPGGPDKIGVTLTLKHDIITNISVQTEPGDRESAHYQQIFASNYSALVVGKNIADVRLDKVSGSSLTSAGFNDALAQIEAQAKA